MMLCWGGNIQGVIIIFYMILISRLQSPSCTRVKYFVYHINGLVDNYVFQLAHLNEGRAFSSRCVRWRQLDAEGADYKKSLMVHFYKMNMNHHPSQREDDGTRQDSSVLGINNSQYNNLILVLHN